MKDRKVIRFVSLAIALTIGTITADAQAAFVYSLVFSQPQYFANPGGTVDVNLILREIATAGESSQIAANGFTRGDVRVNWDGGGSTATTAVVSDPLFNGPSSGTLESGAGFLTLLQRNNSGFVGGRPTGTQVSTTTREVNFGTYTFSLPTSISNTVITLSDAHTGVNDLILNGPINLDSVVSFGSAVISNPEPSTFLLTGMGLIGAAGVSRFRNRRAKAKSAPPLTNV